MNSETAATLLAALQEAHADEMERANRAEETACRRLYRLEKVRAENRELRSKNRYLRRQLAHWVSRWLAQFLDARTEDGDMLAPLVFKMYPGLTARLKEVFQ